MCIATACAPHAPPSQKTGQASARPAAAAAPALTAMRPYWRPHWALVHGTRHACGHAGTAIARVRAHTRQGCGAAVQGRSSSSSSSSSGSNAGKCCCAGADAQQASSSSSSSPVCGSEVSAPSNARLHSFTVTTPLFYVNAPPHMGSAYPTIAADALARYQRLRGRRVHFITGTDEHGEKISLAAAAAGVSPQAHCDAVVRAYQSLWAQLDIDYDQFVRTTSDAHRRVVLEVLERVWEAGDIYKAAYEGWYCVDCEEYKDEKELLAPEHTCPVHRKSCALRKEDNYFFRLSKYQQQLEALVLRSSREGVFVQPSYRVNEVAAWVRAGVRDFSISRAAVDWGIPIPRDAAQTVYVWFDALLGYISGLMAATGATRLEDLSAPGSGWPADVHIIGKDILRFHAVYWPGMLLSAGLGVPARVFGHGFLTRDGVKMGKSLGNIIDPVALVRAYGPDAVRLYFLKEISFGQDGNFSEGHFREMVNAALANNVGNMLNRTLNLLHKFFQGVVPLPAAAAQADHPLRQVAAVRMAQAEADFEELRFHSALESILSLASRANQFLEEKAPWTALKKGSDAEKREASSVLVAVLETARIVAVALSPVTPGLSGAVYAQLGLGQTRALRWGDTAWGGLAQGQATAPPRPIFARLEGDWALEGASGGAGQAPANTRAKAGV